MISFITDKILYPKINEYYSMSERIIRFPFIVLTIAGCSLILSAVVNGISDAIGKISIKRMVIKSEGTK